jgi:hypothetical protein
LQFTIKYKLGLALAVYGCGKRQYEASHLLVSTFNFYQIQIARALCNTRG